MQNSVTKRAVTMRGRPSTEGSPTSTNGFQNSLALATATAMLRGPAMPPSTTPGRGSATIARLRTAALALTFALPPCHGGQVAAAPGGARPKLADGALFIPAGFKPDADGGFELTLHLHGAPTVVERNFVAAKRPGVLANVTLPGLSAAYTERFKDTNAFWRIVRDTEAAVKPASKNVPVRVNRVTVTSFSAGFGGVREMLKDPSIFARLDALVMADSIYAGFTGDAAERKVNPANMEGFLKLAREAANGRKQFILSHTMLHTPTYASTVETADYLLAGLGGQREARAEEWPGGLKLQSSFKRERLEILGFAGDTGDHHMQHLRQLAVFLERLK
jgi:hypothetical protein